MFLHLSVILLTGGCAWLLGGHAWWLPGGHVWLLLGGCVVAPGVCLVAPGGHAWLLLGGMHGCSGGCAWLLPEGGVHGCSGGHAWLLQGACMVARGGVCGCSWGEHAWDTMRYGDTVNERAVRILLECILVHTCFPMISHPGTINHKNTVVLANSCSRNW